MRKLVYGINVSIDGCCDHTKGMPNEEVHDYFSRLLKKADVLLYGRKTYELMVPFWPDFAKKKSGNAATDDFAQTFAAVPRIFVVSKTLEKSASSNTTIIRENLKEEILKLKNEPGRDISLGGVELPAHLIQMGLVDEFHLVIYPMVVGQGRRLFDKVNLEQQFKLAESKIFEAGHVALRYVRKSPQPVTKS